MANVPGDASTLQALHEQSIELNLHARKLQQESIRLCETSKQLRMESLQLREDCSLLRNSRQVVYFD